MNTYCGFDHPPGEWCGECYEVKRGRKRKGSTSPSVLPQDGLDHSPPPPKTVAPKGPPMPSAAPGRPPEAWRALYPVLWSHLTQGKRPDHSHRQTSTLTLFMEGGRIKLCLSDRDRNLVGFITVSSLPDGFAELEDALSRGTLEWRGKKKFPQTRT